MDSWALAIKRMYCYLSHWKFFHATSKGLKVSPEEEGTRQLSLVANICLILTLDLMDCHLLKEVSCLSVFLLVFCCPLWVIASANF